MNRVVGQANEIIRARRLALGLGEVELAAGCGLNVYEYGDIEQYPDELAGVTHLREVKCLCDRLGLDVYEVFGLDCAFCVGSASYDDDYILPRNQLVRIRREALGLSQDRLGDSIGFETVAVENMENDPDFFEEWSFELVQETASVLKVPKQVLLAAKCPRCGR